MVCHTSFSLKTEDNVFVKTFSEDGRLSFEDSTAIKDTHTVLEFYCLSTSTFIPLPLWLLSDYVKYLCSYFLPVFASNCGNFSSVSICYSSVVL